MFTSGSCHLQKLSDDSAIDGVTTGEYREVIQNSVDWYQQNCLQINTGKRYWTFRGTHTLVYYPGTEDALYKKGPSRHFLPRGAMNQYHQYHKPVLTLQRQNLKKAKRASFFFLQKLSLERKKNLIKKDFW